MSPTATTVIVIIVILILIALSAGLIIYLIYSNKKNKPRDILQDDIITPPPVQTVVVTNVKKGLNEPCTQDLDCQTGLICSNLGVCAASRKIMAKEQENVFPVLNKGERLGVKVEVSKMRKVENKSKYGDMSSSVSSSELFNVDHVDKKKYIGNGVKNNDWYKKKKK